MKVTIFNAISIDGFIATKEGNSDWANDVDEFNLRISQADCIIVGRKTFEQFHGNLYPIKGVHNFIYTWHPDYLTKVEGVEAITGHPPKIIKDLRARGFKNILILGGSKTSTSFFKGGVVDELVLDIHPIILSEGIKLFTLPEAKMNLERISQKELNDGIIQITYNVIKPT